MLKKDKKVPMVLVGNKLDLESERRVNRTTGAQAIAGTAPNPLVKNSSTFYGAYDAHNQASYLSVKLFLVFYKLYPDFKI